jgi:hypothetical protein
MATTASAVINTTDTGSNTPTVPDASVTTKWQEYIWIRHLEASNTNKAKIYVWNPNASSDGTYLKWQEVGGASAFTDITGTATTSQLPNNIPYSKLTLTSSVSNNDLAGSISADKLLGGITFSKISTVNASSVTSISNSKIPVDTIPTLSNTNIDTILSAASVDFSKLNINSYEIPANKIAVGIDSSQITSLAGSKITGDGTLNNDRLDFMFERNNPTTTISGTHSGTANLHTLLGSNPFEGVIRLTGTVNGTTLTIALPHPSTAAYLGKSAKISIFRGSSGVGAGGIGKVEFKVCASGTNSGSFSSDKKIVHRDLLVTEAPVLSSLSQANAVDRKIVVNLMCESISGDGSGGGQWVVSHDGETETASSLCVKTAEITGDGSTTEFTIQHNLGTKNIICSVRTPVDPYDTSNAQDPPASRNAMFSQLGFCLMDVGSPAGNGALQVATANGSGAESANHVSLDFGTAPNNGDKYQVTILGIC